MGRLLLLLLLMFMLLLLLLQVREGRSGWGRLGLYMKGLPSKKRSPVVQESRCSTGILPVYFSKGVPLWMPQCYHKLVSMYLNCTANILPVFGHYTTTVQEWYEWQEC